MIFLVIALAAPWAVHLAPPRHRPLALIGGIALVILAAVVRDQNPILGWGLWAGLVLGIGSVALFAGDYRPTRGGGDRGGRTRYDSPWDDVDMTED